MAKRKKKAARTPKQWALLVGGVAFGLLVVWVVVVNAIGFAGAFK